jgi:hypothetical protein
MGLMICYRHGMGPFVHACPHVMAAVTAGSPAPGIGYRTYSIAGDPDLADFTLGCWFCPKCVRAHDLPPHGTALSAAQFDELLNCTSALYQPMCCECFAAWGQTTSADCW